MSISRAFSMYSRYCDVMVAMGMSLISICCLRIRSSSRSSGPSYCARWKLSGEDTILHDSMWGKRGHVRWGRRTQRVPRLPTARARIKSWQAKAPAPPLPPPAIIGKTMRIPHCLPVIALCLLPLSRADVRICHCDVAIPVTLEARECSLCKEAEKQPTDTPYFFLRDTNPNKPHRWLAIPRFHGNHPQQLAEMTPQQRTGYWAAAIAKARETWPNDPWGIALNSTERRSQCHLHPHIGQLLPHVVDAKLG